MDIFPYKPGDWVADKSDNIAKVKDVYESEGEILLDLYIYDREGNKLGRISPVMGGPKKYEPACSSEGWERIKEPNFPIALKWVTEPDGKRSARYYAGERLPALQWQRKPKNTKAPAMKEDSRLKMALEAIAAGHNDPRRLAQEVLGKIAET